jgi:transcriptional regulator with XRE-family HTH domain
MSGRPLMHLIARLLLSILCIASCLALPLMREIFPKRLKAMREKRQLSQADLAKKARLQPTAISHFETGGRSPSFDNLRRLADALNVSTDYLIGRSDEPVLTGPAADSLFRGLEKLSEEDLWALKMMKDVLLAKKGSESK